MFYVSRERPELYKKTIDHLDLYAITEFKNSSHVVLCLWSEEYVGPEEPVLPESTTENDKWVCDYKMNDPLKKSSAPGKSVQCADCTFGCMWHRGQEQIKALPSFKEMDEKLDYMALISKLKDNIHWWKQQSTCKTPQGNVSHYLNGSISRKFQDYKMFAINMWLYAKRVLNWDWDLDDAKSLPMQCCWRKLWPIQAWNSWTRLLIWLKKSTMQLCSYSRQTRICMETTGGDGKCHPAEERSFLERQSLKCA